MKHLTVMELTRLVYEDHRSRDEMRSRIIATRWAIKRLIELNLIKLSPLLTRGGQPCYHLVNHKKTFRPLVEQLSVRRKRRRPLTVVK